MDCVSAQTGTHQAGIIVGKIVEIVSAGIMELLGWKNRKNAKIVCKESTQNDEILGTQEVIT